MILTAASSSLPCWEADELKVTRSFGCDGLCYHCPKEDGVALERDREGPTVGEVGTPLKIL